MSFRLNRALSRGFSLITLVGAVAAGHAVSAAMAESDGNRVRAKPPSSTTNLSMPTESSQPMAISAESLTVKNEDQRVIFDRTVVVKKNDMVLHADHVEVFLIIAPGGSSDGHLLSGLTSGPMLTENNIDRIEASGHVVVTQDTKNATADHAVYRRKPAENVVLTGQPETWEEGYRVRGSKITIWLKEQRSVVEDSRVVISSGEEKGSP